MASIVINGDTSGSVTLQAPAVAGSTVVILPTTSMNMGTGGGSVATNTAFGASALAANSTGNNSTAIGYETLKLSTGDANTAIGAGALDANTSGSFNSAVGRSALGAATTANSNSAFGYVALLSNTTGASNVSVGAEALYSNTTASNNTAVGYQAGYSNVAGGAGFGKNTFVGNEAGYAATGYRNVFYGYRSGYLVTTGNSNTIVGGYDGNTGGPDIRTASNYIVLSDGDGNPRGYFDNNGSFIISNSGAAVGGFGINMSSASYISGIQYLNTTTVAGTGFDFFQCWSGNFGSLRLKIIGNGNVQNANNSYGSTSDIKLKENIVDATPKLDKLMQVRIVNYNKIGDDQKQIGVIAQELEQVFAGMVEEITDRDKEGNDLGTTTKSVKYSVFVPMLIKALQELKAEVDSLKAQINGA